MNRLKNSVGGFFPTVYCSCTYVGELSRELAPCVHASETHENRLKIMLYSIIVF